MTASARSLRRAAAYKAGVEAYNDFIKGLPALVAEKIFLICIQNNGQLVLREILNRLLHDEGLNAHSFRHTHATQLIENGAAPKGVADRLGHANTLITQNLYTYNNLKLQEETAEIFAQNLQTK